MLAKIGRWSLYIGSAMIAIAVVFGLGALVLGYGKSALPLIGLAPLGIVLCFGGLSALVLGSPETRRPDPD